MIEKDPKPASEISERLSDELSGQLPEQASEQASEQDRIARIESILEADLAGEDVSELVSGLPDEWRDKIATVIEARTRLFGLRASKSRYEDWRPDDVIGSVEYEPSSGDPEQLGPYRLLRLLGRGAQGEVYLAEDRRLGRKVALKLLGNIGPAGLERLDRFRREAEVTSRLDDPGICTVYETGRVGRQAYIAMRYVEGITLAQHIELERSAEQRPGAEGESRAPSETSESSQGSTSTQPKSRSMHWVRVVERVARSLEVAHESGVVHRDVKPGNIMLTPRNEPVILDFGLARDLNETGPALTSVSATFGTPAYMSPEQISGHQRPDHRTDIWSLGVMLYELLTGGRPFDEPTRESLYHAILTKNPPDPSRANPSLSGDLRIILETALEKERDRRYRTASDFAEDLQRLRERRPIRARRPGALVRAVRWLQRNPLQASALGGLFLSLAIGLTVSLFLLGESRDALAAESQARRRAEGLRLIAQSQLALEYSPGLALLLAFEGAARMPGDLSASTVLRILDQPIEDRVFVAHDSPIVDTVFSPSGGRVATAAVDGSVGIWDLRSGENIAFIEHSKDAIRGVAFSSDGELFVTGGDDGLVRIYSARDGVKRSEFRAAGVETTGVAVPVQVLGLAVHPAGDSVATSAVDGKVVLWSLSDGSFLRSFEGHEGPVHSVAFDKNGEYLATGGRDGARVFRVQDGNEVAILLRDWDSINDICFSPDGEQVLMAPWRIEAVLWDWKTSAEVRQIARHEKEIYAATIDPGGKYVLTCSMDLTAALWDIESGERLRQFRGHKREARCGRFSADGRRIATASYDGTLRLWSTGQRPGNLRFKKDEDRLSAGFSPGGRELVTCSKDGSATLWDATTGELLRSFSGHEGKVLSASFTPDGERLVTSSDDGTVRSWMVESAQPLQVLRIEGVKSHARTAAAISPDGRRILMTTSAGEAAIFDADSGQVLRRIRGLASFLTKGNVERCAFTWDGRKVMTTLAGERDSRVGVWDVESGELEFTFIGHESVILALDSSPVDSRVVSASADGSARIWDPARPDWSIVLRHEKLISAVRFDPTGELVATCGGDLTTRIWEAATGRQLHVLPGHTGMLASLDFSSDGRLLVTSGRDSNSAVWEVATGERLLVQEAHATNVICVAFNADDSSVMSAAIDGGLRIWPTDPLAFAREWCSRALTDEERSSVFGLDAVP